MVSASRPNEEHRRRARPGGVPDQISNAEFALHSPVAQLLPDTGHRGEGRRPGERGPVLRTGATQRTVADALHERRGEEVLQLVRTEPGVAPVLRTATSERPYEQQSPHQATL